MQYICGMIERTIHQTDANTLLGNMPDLSADIILVDPPYALGSEVIIRPDGKPDYSKAVDFMNKWDQPDGAYWEQWFNHAYRVLKHGGRVVMFGMDRQLMLNKYYACMSGLIEQQSMYWYFISSFPKASDLSKLIDKYYGQTRDAIGEVEYHGNNAGNGAAGMHANAYEGASGFKSVKPVTAPSHDLAVKYNGYKYSIAPLKQTCETIMVFQKPYKSGSCLHDTLAYEAGDTTCLCGALDIDGGRVGTEDNLNGGTYSNATHNKDNFFSGIRNGIGEFTQPSGRYPSQTFCDSRAGEVLDRQSGLLKSGNATIGTGNIDNQKGGIYNSGKGGIIMSCYADNVAGCSKILHHCDYDKHEHDLYIYCPKVSKSERNRVCEGLDVSVKSVEYRQPTGDPMVDRLHGCGVPTHNNHPTVKPLSLIRHILKLFKTPNQQVLVDTFAGSGTVPIVAEELGFTWYACELQPEYITIANARLSVPHTEPVKDEAQLQLF